MNTIITLRSMLKSGTICAAFVTSTMLTTLATADQAPAETPAARVSYADLDLSRAEGQETLRIRVEGAARRVCRHREGRTLRERARARECYAAAVRQAMEQVDTRVATDGRRSVNVSRDAG